MKFLSSEIDIATLLARIHRKELDLQPDFQRGEVWSELKKKRLIDTILRNWHVPPIHVIKSSDSEEQEVLDGQQRLTAIRDFVRGLIRVDGDIKPADPVIAGAGGATYDLLPANLRERFDRFTIRVLTLIDFEPDEPGELFFRLNHPTNLTAAEQRNAFYGPVRGQIRSLVESFEKYGLTERSLGFSNSRMAYHDIIAKICYSLELGTLHEKITALMITDRYRADKGFNPSIITCMEDALRILGNSFEGGRSFIRFNKATLFSWLCFLIRVDDSGTTDMSALRLFMLGFAIGCGGISHELEASQLPDFRTYAGERRGRPWNLRLIYPPRLLQVYLDRASQRVSDEASILLRDGIIVYCYVGFIRAHDGQFPPESKMWRFFVAWNNLLSEHDAPRRAQIEELDIEPLQTKELKALEKTATEEFQIETAEWESETEESEVREAWLLHRIAATQWGTLP